jgi:hypothetical protein
MADGERFVKHAKAAGIDATRDCGPGQRHIPDHHHRRKVARSGRFSCKCGRVVAIDLAELYGGPQGERHRHYAG